MRQRAAFLSVAITLLVAGGAQAMSPFAQRSMARAKADAARELASVVLPTTAETVPHDPSVHRALAPQGVACVKKYVVEDHRFWRVAGRPAKVWVWIRNHPAQQGGASGFGTLKKDGKPLEWDVIWFLRNQSNVASRMISVTLRPARGGGTALRVDAIAVGEPHRGQAPCFSSSY
jgi:hypothetical protein